jgi:hypothetical protein
MWVVDPDLERARRTSADLAATASLTIESVRERCAVLRQRSHELLQGSQSGDALVLDFETASALLADARDRLARALDAIRGITVVVEIPDEDDESQ